MDILFTFFLVVLGLLGGIEYNKIMKKLGTLLTILIFLCTLGQPVFAQQEIKILYTGQLQSQYDPIYTQNQDANEHFYLGGYGRIKTLMDQMEDEVTLKIDTGNFIGSTVYANLNPEYGNDVILLNALGIQVSTLGPNELLANADYLAKTLSYLPEELTLTLSNVQFGMDGFEQIEPYVIKQVGNQKVGIFGLASPKLKAWMNQFQPYEIVDPIQQAEKIIEQFHADDVSEIICLSSLDEEEIQQLVQQVQGIDAIYSSQSLSLDYQTAGETAIISTSKLSGRIGEVILSGRVQLQTTYRVDDTVEPDPTIQSYIDQYHQQLSQGSVTIENDLALVSPKRLKAYQKNDLQKILMDAYNHDYQRVMQTNQNVIGIALQKDIQETLPIGQIERKEIADVFASGIYDSAIGQPVLRLYMRGDDLRHVALLDQQAKDVLYFGNLEYVYNTTRLPKDEIEDVFFCTRSGYYVPVQQDRLYPVMLSYRTYLYLKQIDDPWLNIHFYDEHGAVVEDGGLFMLRDQGILREYILVERYFQYQKDVLRKDKLSFFFQSQQVKRKHTRFELLGNFQNISPYGKHRYMIAFVIVIGLIFGYKCLIWLWNRLRKHEENEIL